MKTCLGLLAFRPVLLLLLIVCLGIRPLPTETVQAQQMGVRGGDFQAAALSDGVEFQPQSSPGGQLINLSTRGFVGTGESALVGGFIIEGGPKTVLIRARGPSLTAFGVTGALVDPTLELVSFPAGTRIDFNDNWRSSSQAATIAADRDAPTDDREPALLVELPPGGYTPTVRGLNDTTGVAIVEVFDRGGDGRLINISTRGFVGTGSSELIGGFIIEGGPTTVLIRARGPSLTALGVAGALVDPTLELVSFPAGTRIDFNDNWRSSSQAPAIEASGQAPTDDREPALLVTLPPGGYTPTVRGLNGTTGVAIVEVFERPSNDNGPPELDISDSSLDFGAVTVGQNSERTLTVTNRGGGTLTGSISAAPPFSIVSGDSFNLGANQSQTVTLRFAPSAASRFTDTVELASNGGSAIVSVVGTGIDAVPRPPLADVSESNLPFDPTPLSQNTNRSFTVRNIGGGTLSGTASTAAAAFSIVSGDTFNLGAGQSQRVTVQFSPTSPGLQSGTVDINSNGGTKTVTVSGVGVEPSPPQCSVSPPSLDFGVVTSGTKDLPFTLTNSGGGTLSGSAVVNPSSPYFQIVSGASFSLDSRQSQSIVVRFSPPPPLVGSFASGNISVFETGNESTCASVALSGSGPGCPPGVFCIN